MRDRDIRTNLRRELERAHRDFASETLFINEFGLCQGNARVDVAVVNGSLSGYEIKSEKDTLQRLPHQVDIYSRALDYVTIVVSELHLQKVTNLIPEWWGIIGAFYDQGDIKFNLARQPLENPSVDPLSVAQLLWRPEALTLLGEWGQDKGMASKPRRLLWKKLAESQSLDELRRAVRRTLKVRARWRSELPPLSHDGLSQSSAR